MRAGRGVRVTRKQVRRVRWQLAAIVRVVVLAGVLSHGVQPIQAADPVKVGILHSLSGTMAISEAPIKEVVLMAIDEINATGGVLGRKVEPLIEDPAYNWELFAEEAKRLKSDRRRIRER